VGGVTRNDPLKVKIVPLEDAEIVLCGSGRRFEDELCVIERPFGLPPESGLNLLN
jgi:hypothetical protein